MKDINDLDFLFPEHDNSRFSIPLKLHTDWTENNLDDVILLSEYSKFEDKESV
jgi:hypothetical protein